MTFLINSLRGGGAERVCATLANELREKGWAVEILVLNLRDAVVRSAVHSDIKIVDLGVAHVRGAALRVARYIREARPTKFLVFNHQLAILLVWLRWLRTGRFSIVARNISTLSQKAALERSFWHGRVVHALTRIFYRQVDRIIAQSEGMKRDLMIHYGIPPELVTVIHNPLPQRFLQDPGTLIPWESRGSEILFVGRLAAPKGLDLLLDAFRACLQRCPDLVLRLVGDGDQKHSLEHSARRLGIAERVLFEGYVEDPMPFYSKARALVLTSHYEGFPNVLLEAISQGTPVVSVDCPSGPAEIIEENVNGLLVRERNAQLFAGAIERAVRGPWDARRVRQSVLRFSPRDVAQLYAAELSSMVDAFGAQSGAG